MNRRFASPGQRRQAGAAALLAAVFLIIIVLLLGQIVLRTTATGVNDSLLQHDAVMALYLAESGIERAAGQLSAGTTTCGAGLSGTWNYAGGTLSIINIGADSTRDFNGAALPAGKCRVRSTGGAGLFAAQRTLEAIINTNGNLLGGANAAFNAPTPPSCANPGPAPNGWVLSPGGWDSCGGPDGSRAAYVEKPSPGSSEVTSAGQYSFSPFTITAPTTLTLTFDYKLNTSGGGGQRMELTFFLISGATQYTAAGAPFQTSHTGVFQNGSVTFNVPGSGSVSIDGFAFEMVARSGQPKYGWLDNLLLTGSGAGTASVERWRELVQ